MITVTLPEAMLRFRCNLRGCCCQGWAIAFTVREAADIAAAFGPLRRSQILAGAVALHDAKDGRVVGLDLRRDGPRGACQFLQGDALCEVHAQLGEARLPSLCASFPAFAFDAGARRVLSWDPVCPEVLERLDEAGPYALATVEAQPGTTLHARAAVARTLPPLRLGGRELDAGALAALEVQLRALLEDPSGPALDQLARVNVGLARAVGPTGDATFVAPEVSAADLAAFDAFFDACVEAHDAHALARFVRAYRRFVFALDLGALDLDPLTAALAFDPDWRQTLDPRAAELQPLLRRYLAHRFFNAFERSPRTGDVAFNYQTVNHTLATAFRIALALARHLGRAPERTILKVALGCSEFVFRSLDLPAESMPWFGLDAG